MTAYDKLLLLPFFQGIDRKELEDIASRIRLDFQKYNEGERIVRANDRCKTLMLLMEGRMLSEGKSADCRYSIQEYMDAPCVIEPERLFGLQQYMEREYQALSKCVVLKLQKDDVLRLCAESLVFEINVLNTISTISQRVKTSFWRTPPISIPHKIATFVANRCVRPAGEKILRIRLTDLGKAIGEARINVSHTIHTLEQQGLLSFSRQTITIYHLEKLLLVDD